jgi:hypothetical protein
MHCGSWGQILEHPPFGVTKGIFGVDGFGTVLRSHRHVEGISLVAYRRCVCPSLDVSIPSNSLCLSPLPLASLDRVHLLIGEKSP